MPITFVPFDGWSPGGGYFGEGWANTLNLYPSFDSWRPWRTFDLSGNSLADGPLCGRHAHQWTAGIGTTGYLPDLVTLFTGSPTRLYVCNPSAGTFAGVSPVGFTANAAAWRFASVGNDIWATNWLDPMQRRTNNAGNFAAGVVSTFKPVPRFLVTVREHMLVANLTNAGRFQDEIAWSDADDVTNYDKAVGTSTSLAGNKRLTSIPGQITGLVGGQYALAFKRNAIFYLEYTGTTQVFRPDVLSNHIGTALPSSIIDSRYGVFFLGGDGFYVIQGLGAPQKISTPGVDQFLLESLFSQRPSSGVPALVEDMQMFGFQSPSLPLIGWTFRYDWNTQGAVYGIVYNPVTQQWSPVTVAEAAPAPYVTCPVELPYSIELYSSLGAFAFDGTTARYASLSSSSVHSSRLQLRFRPANFEDATEMGQSVVTGILPVFSKLTPATTGTLRPTVTVEPMLDPFRAAGPAEVRVDADRSGIAGWYPFQASGRLFRITIDLDSSVPDPDFSDFHGVWVNQRLLR